MVLIKFAPKTIMAEGVLTGTDTLSVTVYSLLDNIPFVYSVTEMVESQLRLNVSSCLGIFAPAEDVQIAQFGHRSSRIQSNKLSN